MSRSTVEKIVSVMQDPETMQRFTRCPSPADAQRLLLGKGIKASVGEVKEAAIRLMRLSIKSANRDGELSEETLEKVAGGASAITILGNDVAEWFR